MRKYLRSIARHNMKKAGIERMNKPLPGGGSLFSIYWRKFIKKENET